MLLESEGPFDLVLWLIGYSFVEDARCAPCLIHTRSYTCKNARLQLRQSDVHFRPLPLPSNGARDLVHAYGTCTLLPLQTHRTWAGP